MTILNAKNKRLLKTAAMFLGLIVLVAAIARAINAGARSVGDVASTAWADLKSNVINFKSIVILLGVGVAFASYYFTDAGETVQAVALGVLITGAGVVTTFNSTYVPKRFHYTAATQLTGVKITVQGDGVIFDSDANGLNHVGVSRLSGQITNTYEINIANGFIPGKNVIWEFTNSAAQTPTIYVDSDQTPAPGEQMYLQLLRQAVLANSGQDFTDFATLSLPSLAAADVVNILQQDGTQQQLNRADIQARLAYLQNIVNTPVYMIDNFARNVKRVNVIAGAAQTAYVQRWVPVVGGAMISQVVNGI